MAAAKGDRRVELGLVVARALGGHRKDHAVAEFEPARRLLQGPGHELVGR